MLQEKVHTWHLGEMTQEQYEDDTSYYLSDSSSLSVFNQVKSHLRAV